MVKLITLKNGNKAIIKKTQCNHYWIALCYGNGENIARISSWKKLGKKTILKMLNDKQYFDIGFVEENRIREKYNKFIGGI